MSYISVQTAADQIGVTLACLFRDCDKYRPFLRKSTEGKHDAGFDLKNFLAKEELKTELVEKTRLLTEYLYHIEQVSYTDVANHAGITPQQIHQCNFGYESALKIARAVKKDLNYEWIRFHKYYGWSAK